MKSLYDQNLKENFKIKKQRNSNLLLINYSKCLNMQIIKQKIEFNIVQFYNNVLFKDKKLSTFVSAKRGSRKANRVGIK